MRSKWIWPLMAIGALSPVGIFLFSPGSEHRLVFNQDASHGTGGLTGSGALKPNEGFVVAQEAIASSDVTLLPVPQQQRPMVQAAQDTQGGAAVSPVVQEPGSVQDPQVVMPQSSPAVAPTITPEARPQLQASDVQTPAPVAQAEPMPVAPVEGVIAPSAELTPVMRPMLGEDGQAVAPVVEESAVAAVPEEPVQEPAVIHEDPEILAFAQVVPVVISLNDTYRGAIVSATEQGDGARVSALRRELAGEIRAAVESIPGLSFERYVAMARMMVDNPDFSQKVMALLP